MAGNKTEIRLEPGYEVEFRQENKCFSLEFSKDGKFFVNGELLKTNLDLANAFEAFLASTPHIDMVALPNRLIADIKEAFQAYDVEYIKDEGSRIIEEIEAIEKGTE
jgi:hypothetical protein